MSSFKNPRFVKEMAYRTMVNYYILREIDPEKIPKSQALKGVLYDMKTAGFDTSMRYEITLALNSMVGLLIFPEQAYYNEASSDYGFKMFPELEACMQDESYINTFEKGKNKPAEILRHMRNAVAHEKISIFPVSADSQSITHIVFKDKNGKTGEEFSLTIPAEKLEAVLMEIAEYLISFEE